MPKRLILAFITLVGTLLCAQQFPTIPWNQLQEKRTDHYELINPTTGVTEFLLFTSPRDLLPYVKIQREDDGVRFDTTEAMKQGMKEFFIHFAPVDITDLPGNYARMTIDIEGTNKSRLALYFEGASESRRHYYTSRNVSIINSRRTFEYIHQLAPDVTRLHLRYNLYAAGSFKVYGGSCQKSQRPVTPKPTSPELLFHASFDKDATADFAKGNPTPVKQRNLTFGPGIINQAVRLTKEAKSTLQYAIENNVVPKEGTVTLWYKPDDGGEFTIDWRTFFAIISPNPQKGDNAAKFWYWDRARIRGDISDLLDSYKCKDLPFAPGRWHHLAMTWSPNGVNLFVNGDDGRGISDSWTPLAFLKSQAVQPLFFNEMPDFKIFSIGSNDTTSQADGWIDDVRIFSGNLSKAQIKAIAEQGSPIKMQLLQRYLWKENKDITLQTILENKGAPPLNATWKLLDKDKNTVLNQDTPFPIQPQNTLPLNINLPKTLPVGAYSLHVLIQETQQLIINDICIMERANPEIKVDGELNLKKVTEITFDKLPPAERYKAIGECTIKELNGTPYLEVGPNAGDRFAVHVKLDAKKRLYCFDITYPDDTVRTADVLVQNCKRRGSPYVLQVGYMAGDEFPNQHKMLTHRCLFWNDNDDVALVMMTARDNAPAAIAKLAVYEVVGPLPKATVKEAPAVNGAKRTFGIYFEDPAINFDFAVPGQGRTLYGIEALLNRFTAYLDYTAQNIVAYPGNWYQGAIGEGYNPRGHVPEFLEAFMMKFDQAGIDFIPTFNHHNLIHLDPSIYGWHAVEDGSFHNTPVSIFNTGLPNPGGWHSTPPNFNITHPEVQKQFLKDLDNLLAIGVKHPSFKGVALHLTEHCIHSFGSLKAGYNDYTIDLFTKDTGIKVPVDRKDPMRGKLYATWLLENAREQWISWRCKWIADWYKTIADKLSSARPDLKLYVNNITYPSVKDENFEKDGFRYQFGREAGIDGKLLDVHNIVYGQTTAPADTRHHYYKDVTPERLEYLKYMDVKPQLYENIVGFNKALVWLHMHDRYWESAIGRSASKYSLTSDWMREHTWRVSTLNPTDFHAMRHFALPFRYTDVQMITKGGFLIGTYGMEQYLTPFAQAFRALPALHFKTLKISTDVVKARAIVHEGKRWFYVINTDGKPQDFSMKVKSPVTDLVTGSLTTEQKDGVLKLKLQPYQLRSFSVPVN